MNSRGHRFRITTFGESHGPAIGVVVDGCPSGLAIDLDFIQSEMNRRRPRQSAIVSQRKEEDAIEILSGVYEGKTLGTPIAMVIRNNDAKSADYDHLMDVFRPGHADHTWAMKYGHRDPRGGGRSSARETAARVAAGAIAKLYLRERGIEVKAYVSSVGDIVVSKPYTELDLDLIESNPVRCPDQEIAQQMEARIAAIKKAGDTIGGTVTCVITGCPAGLGEPVFDKLHANLGKAILSINACKGFEIGDGFASTLFTGSAFNDLLIPGKEPGSILTETNRAGGINGGISNGMDIWFRAAFKPVATIMRDQPSVNSAGEITTVKGKGRHDPCVLPRAVPIVEAMAALVIIDELL